jgi:hypothetical protein
MALVLSLPFKLIFALGGLYALVKLAIEGEWLAIALGVSGIFVGPVMLGLLLLPGAVFAVPAAKALERGTTKTFATLSAFSLAYTFVVFAIWGTVIFFYFLQNLPSNLQLAAIYWSFVVASAPVAFLAYKERDNPHSQLSTTIFILTCLIAGIVVQFIDGRYEFVAFVFFGGAILTFVLSLLNLNETLKNSPK